MKKDEFGATLKDERLKRDISLRKLAELSGVNKTTIQRIESGEVSPSLETFEKILNAMSLCLKVESKRKNT